MPNRKRRGSDTQALVAQWYRVLWPAATTAGSGTAGRDILNVPCDIEVKARRGFSPLEWIRQGRSRQVQLTDELPRQVVMRPDGLGEARIGEWLVIRTLEDDTAILMELLARRDQPDPVICYRSAIGVMVHGPYCTCDLEHHA
jgi:hypothetical protein